MKSEQTGTEEMDFLSGVQACPLNLTGDDTCTACQ